MPCSWNSERSTGRRIDVRRLRASWRKLSRATRKIFSAWKRSSVTWFLRSLSPLHASVRFRHCLIGLGHGVDVPLGAVGELPQGLFPGEEIDLLLVQHAMLALAGGE